MGCTGSKDRNLLDCSSKDERPNIKTRHDAQGTAYENIEREKTVKEVIHYYTGHAVVLWIVVPILVGMQAVVPALLPICDIGFVEWFSGIVVIIVIASHFINERQAWAAAKKLCTQPEMTIMRTHGVLKKRRNNFVLGIICDLDSYTDMLFPLVAYVCNDDITDSWISSWRFFPAIQQQARTFHFWMAALTLLTINWLLEIFGLIRLVTFKPAELDNDEKDHENRVSGKDFVGLAAHSETANMPTVAHFCEEMAVQKKFLHKHDNDKNEQHSEREKLVFGKTFDPKKVLALEAVHAEVERRIERETRIVTVLNMVLKIIIGNAAQLWLQSSLFMFTFLESTPRARDKVIASMVLSILVLITRTMRATSSKSHLGAIGMILNIVSFSVVAWAGFKVYKTYTCEGHLWNLSTGCEIRV